MIEVFPFAGLPVAVFGLGRSGRAAARSLTAGGAEVWAWDDAPAAREAAAAEGVPLVDLSARDFAPLTSLVLSPGVALDHPIAARARAAGLELIGDIELLARTMRAARYIGITGTNGKSTTTALVGHLLALAGETVEVGGNLGTPALALEPLDFTGTYVLEMSSFQLDLTVSLTFDVAALINLSPDHLDRHGSFDAYRAAKRRIFHRQTAPRTAVVAIDDEPSRAVYDALAAAADQRLIPVATGEAVAGGVFVSEAGVLHDAIEGSAAAMLDLTGVATLPGRHNWQNAGVAYAVARAAGVAGPVAAAALRSFPGLAHRLERIAVIEGVAFVNDSKATNAEATARALACYDRIYWIAGGRAKTGGIAALAPFLGRIAHAYLIGEAAEAFADELAGKVPTTVSGDLETAVADAAGAAEAGSVVLLSPACASFDQFADFEARGEAFRALVAALPGAREDDDPLPALAGGCG